MREICWSNKAVEEEEERIEDEEGERGADDEAGEVDNSDGVAHGGWIDEVVRLEWRCRIEEEEENSGRKGEDFILL